MEIIKIVQMFKMEIIKIVQMFKNLHKILCKTSLSKGFDKVSFEIM